MEVLGSGKYHPVLVIIGQKKKVVWGSPTDPSSITLTLTLLFAFGKKSINKNIHRVKLTLMKSYTHRYANIQVIYMHRQL